MGRRNSNPSSGSSGHTGDTRPGQTRKKPKDLSVREREERGCGEGGCCVIYCHSKVFMVQGTRLYNLLCYLVDTCGQFHCT